ncbi:MAG: SURF1 family protein [Caulobacteraceae bacterium]|nr:SURF1 family protein [Caulobacteraceae bacterium]
MRRLPPVLTLCAALGFAILVGLGIWQVQRLAWKRQVLARVAELRTAAPRPLAAALRLAHPEFVRIEARCLGAPAAPGIYRYALHAGVVGWRLLTACRLAPGDAPPYDGAVLDRGLVDRFTGAMAPLPAAYPAPGAVVGVLRRPGARPWLDVGAAAPSSAPMVRVVDRAALFHVAALGGLGRPAPFLVAVERERPPVAGVAPAPLPEDIPNNHLVYALTWFGLAASLAWIYAAMVSRRWRDA